MPLKPEDTESIQEVGMSRAKTLKVVSSLLCALLAAIAANAASKQKTKWPTSVRPASQEAHFGRISIEKMLTESGRTLVHDKMLKDRVNEIGRELVRHMELPESTYKFQVVSGNDLQAFGYGGGMVAVTERLARIRSDGEVAFVLGHELGHSVRRHHVSLERLGVALNGLEASTADSVVRAFMEWSDVEADMSGVVYMMDAGYNPGEALAFLARLKSQPAGYQPSFFKSHRTPLTPKEVKRILDARLHYMKNLIAYREDTLETLPESLRLLEVGNLPDAKRMAEFYVDEFPKDGNGHRTLGAILLGSSIGKNAQGGVSFDHDKGYFLWEARHHFQAATKLDSTDHAANKGDRFALALLELDESVAEQGLWSGVKINRFNVPVDWIPQLARGDRTVVASLRVAAKDIEHATAHLRHDAKASPQNSTTASQSPTGPKKRKAPTGTSSGAGSAPPIGLRGIGGSDRFEIPCVGPKCPAGW